MAAAGVAAILLVGVAATQLPAIGAGGLLHPSRRRMAAAPPPGCEAATFSGEMVNLQGWRCRARGARRGTLVYLHGIADNRSSGIGIIQRFGARGFDTVAYDSRGHGESDGDTCTYGFFEKDDLRRVLDTVDSGPIVLIGTSLGAAVALQQAARDTRIAAVVAVESFSDLRTVATERAPFFFTSGLIERAFTLAEQQAQFRIEAVSPEAAARSIQSPVLVIHGAADVETLPAHAHRVFAALAGPKRLILVPGAHHNGSLRGEIWGEIERWLDEVLAQPRDD
jgi:hypothetical protein